MAHQGHADKSADSGLAEGVGRKRFPDLFRKEIERNRSKSEIGAFPKARSANRNRSKEKRRNRNKLGRPPSADHISGAPTEVVEKLGTECTKIAHRRSLAIFAADSGIAGNSAVGIKFVHFNRRENRRSLAIFFAEEIAHLGP